jgi:tripartite-type tricarboxylate transporter receptor subunit TctC
MSGQVDATISSFISLYPHIQAGRLRLIAIGRATRSPKYPEYPTIAETLPGFLSSAWYAVVAPPKTPEAIVKKINADVSEALKDPAIVDRLKNLSCEVVGGSPQQARDFMRQETERWGKVIRSANIKLQ